MPITEHGWLPRNTVVTLQPGRVIGALTEWTVIDWTSWPGMAVGGSSVYVTPADFAFVRVRAQGGGPWAYERVKAKHYADAQDRWWEKGY